MDLDEFLAEWHNDCPTIKVQTSGSTGKPKQMQVEKKRMLASARITCDFLGLQNGDSALLCMSLDYIAGKMMVVRSIERRLQLICIPPSGHPLKDWHGEAPTFAAMVPMQVYNSLLVSEEKNILQQIRHLIIGGGAIDEKLATALKDFPNSVWSTYGMTETLSHIALRRLNGQKSSNWYTPFSSVKISQNVQGCLVIEAPNVCNQTLETHDRVEIQDGQFRILGRIDNVIDSGGIKIQIEEVENQLKPYLKEPFAITRQKDEKFGDRVVLLTTANNLSTSKRICQQHLPKYWQPLRYYTVDQLPQTETGKPARAQIEQLAANLMF